MKNSIGKGNAARPYEGKPHVRFDEGRHGLGPLIVHIILLSFDKIYL